VGAAVVHLCYKTDALFGTACMVSFEVAVSQSAWPSLPAGIRSESYCCMHSITAAAYGGGRRCIWLYLSCHRALHAD
jgi:hypothetical protein